VTSRFVTGFFAALSVSFSGLTSAQTVASSNGQTAASAEAERKIMESTLGEVLKIVGEDSDRGKMFRKAQNEWIQYVKEQAAADADGVSGEAKYPASYFQTMRELTRYRTRILEGCLSRVQAEQLGGQIAQQAHEGAPEAASSGNNSARDWKAEIGDAASADDAILYQAEIEGIPGIVAGQWRGEEFWRGVFIADRGDSMTIYGGKMERGGIVFEAWQEGTRIGRGFVRDEDGDLRGRFFDERRRESPMVLKAMKRPNPVTYDVSLTSYKGLLGADDVALGLEWHDTRFVQGSHGEENRLSGHNYAAGKLFLAESEPGEAGNIVAFWSLAKKSGGGSVRWVGQRSTIEGKMKTVEFGR